MAYKVYEYISSLNKKDRTEKGTFTSAQKVCDFIKAEYDINTTAKDLIYAIGQNYGEAWLYPFWGFIEVVKK